MKDYEQDHACSSSVFSPRKWEHFSANAGCMGRCYPPVGLDIGQESPPRNPHFKEFHASTHCTQHHNLPRPPSQKTAPYDPKFSYLHKILAPRTGQRSLFKVSLVSQCWVFGLVGWAVFSSLVFPQQVLLPQRSFFSLCLLVSLLYLEISVMFIVCNTSLQCVMYKNPHKSSADSGWKFGFITLLSLRSEVVYLEP